MENCVPISKADSESSKRDYKAGYFFNGNIESTPGRGTAEGSQGLAEDQGQIREAMIPEINELTMGQQNMRLKEQGTLVQLKKI